MDIDTLFDLSGKVAVVTGAGDGIGKGVSLILAAAGASVVVSDLSIEKAQTTAAEITSTGGKAAAVACNALIADDLNALIKFTVDRYGTVNILVNNAGLGGGGKENPFEIDREYVERIYAINLIAPWQLCRLAAPYMKESGYGSIINITSMSSINSSPDMAIYASSKASVLTPEIEAKMLAHTPLKRLGEVSDIAAAVLFFASPLSGWISGQTLMVNGGGVQTLD